MSCNILRHQNGGIKEVVADNNQPSLLYKEALKEFGEKQAIDIYLASKSDDFQDNIILSQNELDVNNEPKLKTVLNYLSLQNESKEPLTVQQKLDLKNVALGVENFSVQKLLSAFYSEGIFNISPKKLKKSGLYSDYEIANLANDVNLQQTVKQSLEALKNTEDVEIENEFTEGLEKSIEINSFGKLVVLNPFIIQKEILNKLAATTEEEFESNLADLEYPNFQKSLNREQLFQEMQGYKKAEVFMEVDGEIVQAKNTNTAIVLPLVVQQINNLEILQDINQIQQYDLEILQANQEDTINILKEIESNLIEQGIDVAGLSDREINGEMMSFLGELEIFINEPSIENTQSFANIYDTYFEKDLSPKKEIVKQIETDRDFVKLNTNLSEEEVYEQQGFIKVKDGLYIRTNKQDLETLYASLETYTDKYPKDAILKEYVQNEISQLEDFKNSNNAESVYLYKMYFELEKKIHQQSEQLKRRIHIFTKKDLENDKKAQEARAAFENYTDIALPLSANYLELLKLMDLVTNGEVLDKLPYDLIEEDYAVTELDVRNLISKYDRALDRLELIDSELSKIIKYNLTKTSANFTGNFEYLTTDFVSDFYIEILKEREKNSEIYKNFYSNFDVNENGIYLKNYDSITMSQIKEYADENLKQYSIISKQMPLLIEQDIQSETKQVRRDAILNNPQNLNKYQGQSHKLNDNNIILKNSYEEFIKIEGNIFEAVDTDGNLTLYSRLNNIVGEYYNFNNEAPKTNVKIEDYSYLNTQPEKFVSEKNHLSKSAKEKIIRENFDCI